MRTRLANLRSDAWTLGVFCIAAFAGKLPAQDNPDLAMAASKERPRKAVVPSRTTASSPTKPSSATLAKGPLVAAAVHKRKPGPRPGSTVEQAAEAIDDAVERKIEAEEKAPSRRLRWVDVRRLEAPSEESRVVGGEMTLPPWSLFREEGRYDPGLVSDTPAFDTTPPEKSGIRKALERVARKKFYSEVRRLMKRSWRKEFRADPTLAYSTFLDGITRINHIGRDDSFSPTELESEYFSNELKENLFRSGYRDGEVDFEIFALGPLVVMDSGSVRFDLGRAVHFDIEEPPRKQGEIQPAPKPLLSTKDYRIHTSVKLAFDPLEAYKQEDPTWIVDGYGLSVEVDWLSDVLGREIMTTEFEVEFERDGEYAAMVNFVFRSRN